MVDWLDAFTWLRLIIFVKVPLVKLELTFTVMLTMVVWLGDMLPKRNVLFALAFGDALLKMTFEE